MSKSEQTISKMNLTDSEKSRSLISEWADLLCELADRVTGNKAVVKYEFDKLTLTIPKATSPHGESLGSFEFIINGKLSVDAEKHT